MEYQNIMRDLHHMPSRQERDPALVENRHRGGPIIKQRLATLVQHSPPIHQFINKNVELYNGTKGDPRTFDLLHELLDGQAYRLAYWRVASEEINYRRFFDINELAAIRMENPEVFRHAHKRIFKLLKSGAVTGLRIDHVDGLNDPTSYLRHLQEWAAKELPQGSEALHHGKASLFVVVEKILGKDELLPENWPIYGTTGYAFMNLLNGLFVNAMNHRAMEMVYQRITPQRKTLEDLVYESKQLIMKVSMASEINALGHQLNRLSEKNRRSRDFTLNSLTHTIREIIACFPVYRTYVTEETAVVTEQDRHSILRAVAKAKRKNPALSGLVFDFVRDLLLHASAEEDQDTRTERLAFIAKFQQCTSPVTAKGIEDTAFYIYNRLVSLNEVGGDPDQFGVSLATFHTKALERQAHWPHSLSATTTHDTKRSEDVRARINVLSELPQEWRTQVTRWSRMNKKFKTRLEGGLAPDTNEEYLLYQTLIGAWPFEAMDKTHYRFFCDRIQVYMGKAMKEAKIHTSWVNPDHAYDDAMAHFLDRLLDRTMPNPFLEHFLPFQKRIAQYGMATSLSQVLIKIMAPGIPDFYQGTELWDFNLVDPDNRRPVDYVLRSRYLAELQEALDQSGTNREGLMKDLLKTSEDGRIKLFVTMVGLQYRRTHRGLVQGGEYLPLDIQGRKREHLCAFARVNHDHAAVVVAPRLLAGLMPGHAGFSIGADTWEDTTVTVPPWKPRGRYRNLFTEERFTSMPEGERHVLPLSQVCGTFPIALLERLP